MSVDHLIMYEKMTASKRYIEPPLPDWVYKQSLSYPHHDRHSELIEVYREAKKQHDESVQVLHFAYQRKWQDPENSQKCESVKQCQQQVEEAKKALESAQQILLEFNNHMPEQRISLYEAEIKEWETQLEVAQEAEAKYTQSLLNDPNAARARLERQLNGSGASEYSPEQLSQLRSLKNEVESIEAKILICQRDIERIHELVAQEERKARVQATMDAALPKFNKACARLAEAWEELQSLAAEHDLRIVSRHDIQIPTGVTFRQSNNPYEGKSTISLSF